MNKPRLSEMCGYKSSSVGMMIFATELLKTESSLIPGRTHEWNFSKRLTERKAFLRRPAFRGNLKMGKIIIYILQIAINRPNCLVFSLHIVTSQITIKNHMYSFI